jgi:hypothetical protein
MGSIGAESIIGGGQFVDFGFGLVQVESSGERFFYFGADGFEERHPSRPGGVLVQFAAG